MRKNISKPTMPIAVICGLGVSLLLATAFTAIISSLVLNMTIDTATSIYLISVIHVVTVYVGCVISKLLFDGRQAVVESICGSSYLLTLVIMNLLFSDSGIHRVVSSVFAVAIGVICAVFTFRRPSNRGVRRKTKARFR